MSKGCVISVQGMEKTYRNIRIGPIDMEMEPGFVYAIMGPNGSGKSTLFRALIGAIRTEQGKIRLFNGEYGPLDVEPKKRIAYVPEQLDVPDESWTLRVWREFVSVLYPGWNHEKYQLLLDRYSLKEDEKLRNASKGNRRKASLILALSQEPDVLLLDEISSGLDPFAWRLMLEDLSDFMAAGDRTIVMATHVMEEIERFADYVYLLHHGRFIGRYEKDALLDGWKMFWIDRMPPATESIPGVVAVEKELPLRLISNSPLETEQAFRSLGIPIQQMRKLELDEIFLQLVRMKEKR